MSQKLDTSPAVIGIDIGKNLFHIVGQNQRGAIVLRENLRPAARSEFGPDSFGQIVVGRTLSALRLPPLAPSSAR